MSEQLPPEGLEALADELRRLAPRDPALDRDATLFRAGRASARSGWLWPAATLASSLTAAVLGIALYLQPPPQTVTVRADAEPPSRVEPTAADLPSADGVARHRRLRDQLIQKGFDGLPPAPAAPPQPAKSFLSHYSELYQGEPSP